MNFLEPIAFRPGFPVAQFLLGDMRNLVYLVLDWKEKKAAIVDPQRDLSEVTALLDQHQFTLTDCLLTHSHHDHIAGVPILLRSHPELKFWVHARDAHRLANLTIPEKRLEIFSGTARIALGSLAVQALPTPGHSAGEVCYALNCAEGKFLFTGDTLFIRDCGRTDFPDSDNNEMFASLNRIKALPPETWILPGHHYQKDYFSTLAREIATSPPLLCQSVEELMRLP